MGDPSSWMVYNMDDLGVPPFYETSICSCPQLVFQLGVGPVSSSIDFKLKVFAQPKRPTK